MDSHFWTRRIERAKLELLAVTGRREPPEDPAVYRAMAEEWLRDAQHNVEREDLADGIRDYERLVVERLRHLLDGTLDRLPSWWRQPPATSERPVAGPGL